VLARRFRVLLGRAATALPVRRDVAVTSVLVASDHDFFLAQMFLSVSTSLPQFCDLQTGAWVGDFEFGGWGRVHVIAFLLKVASCPNVSRCVLGPVNDERDLVLNFLRSFLERLPVAVSRTVLHLVVARFLR